MRQDNDTASNDASYSSYALNDSSDTVNTKGSDVSCGYKKLANKYSSNEGSSDNHSSKLESYHKILLVNEEEQIDISMPKTSGDKDNNDQNTIHGSIMKNKHDQKTMTTHSEVSERIFMTSLIKHTGIALAIIIPLAAFSAYAATPAQTGNTITSNQAPTTTIDMNPNAIIYKSASEPTTVDSVDLDKYAGTWYEIARLPMYFQRNCASDVTANYTEKTDGSGIIVTNKCLEADGSKMVAEGLAKPADTTGSKLKVTFLPSWIRWLPVGRADYWVLARDADYQTSLVGTPDKKYLWLLARSPNVTQQTYAKYRQIAQGQGYDLKEFTLTPHSSQTVSLVP